MAVKEKSFSFSRFFHKSSAKFSKRVSQPCSTSCEIHTNERTNDCHSDKPTEKTETNNNHQQLAKTRSDSELSLTKTNTSSSSTATNSLTRKSKNSSKTSTSSSPSEPVQGNSMQQCDSDADYERIRTTYAILFEAIHYEDISMLHNAMKSYPNLNINNLNEDGIAAIHFAAMVGSTACIEPLIQYGANIDLKDIRGNPSLHYAFSMQKFNFAGKLLNLGAKTNHLSKRQYPELKNRSRKTWHNYELN